MEVVDAGPRIGFRGLRLARSSYEGRGKDGKDKWGWNGSTYTLTGREVLVPGAGVVLRRDTVVSIDTYLRNAKHLDKLKRPL